MIASQTLLAAQTWTDVYHAKLTYGTEICVEVIICNQSETQWSTLDMALLAEAQSVPEDRDFLYRGYSMKPSETLHRKVFLQSGNRLLVRAVTAKVSVTVMSEEVVTPRELVAVEERIDAVAEEVRELKEIVTASVTD